MTDTNFLEDHLVWLCARRDAYREAAHLHATDPWRADIANAHAAAYNTVAARVTHELTKVAA